MPEYLPFIIAKREQLTPTDITFLLRPENGQIFDYQPGQFAMVGLYDDRGQITTKKAYSICSAPTNKNELQLAYKIQGVFTHQLATLKEGDRLAIAGPFGVFTLPKTLSRDAVFLAGGIGITPILSMLRYAAEMNIDRQFTLFHAVRTPEELAFRSELDELSQKHPNFHCIYFAEKAPTGWNGELGRISDEKLQEYGQPLVDKEFIVCGPPIFIQVMIGLLEKHGVPADQIHNEKF